MGPVPPADPPPVGSPVLRATEVQRAAFAARPVGAIALLDLLGSGDPDAFVRYTEGTLAAVRSAGGRRVYGGALDRSGPGRPLAPYDAVVLDRFPSRASCARALEAAPDPRGALRDRCAIPVRPAPLLMRALIRILSGLARLRPLRLREDPGPFPAEVASDAIGPTAEEAMAFMEADQHLSVVVVNLNRYRPRARYAGATPQGTDASGAEAYARYGRNTAPLVLRRGGRVLFAGTPEPALIATPGDPMAGPWDGFALVHYPSRLAMRDMIDSEAYRRGLPHREAGLSQAAVGPGTPWPAFDPK